MKPNVVIFGAGQAGLAAIKNVSADCHIVAICDNDKNKVGEVLEGVEIVAPDTLSELDFEQILVASEYSEQICQQLHAMPDMQSKEIIVLSASSIKPFHFGDNATVRLASEKVLLVLCKVLSELNIKHYVDAGTLLGLYRDGELIPWDDDLDFALPADQVAKVRQHADTLLAALSTATNQKWEISEYFASQDFGLVRKGDIRSFKLAAVGSDKALPLVDFFIKYSDDKNMDYVIASRGFSMPSQHMCTLSALIFRGEEVAIPGDPEGYLSRHYGDWRTPKQDWTLQHIQSSTVFGKA